MTRFHRSIAPVLALALAVGCGGAPMPDAADPQSSPDAAGGVIHGQASYRERIAPPPDARLRVRLVDAPPADGPDAIVADQELAAGNGPPFAFALSYDPARLRGEGPPTLHVGLYDGGGRRWFVTDPPVPLDVESGEVVEVVLVRSADEDPVPAEEAFEGSDAPWDAARERGMVYRAIGQEPGWLADVGGGDAPTLHLQLDYATRTMDVPEARAFSEDGVEGFRAELDGVRVELSIADTPCQDSMSGQRFDTTARLRVGDETFDGCGRRLD